MDRLTHPDGAVAFGLGLWVGIAWFITSYAVERAWTAALDWAHWFRESGRAALLLDAGAAITWALLGSGLIGLLVITTTHGSTP